MAKRRGIPYQVGRHVVTLIPRGSGRNVDGGREVEWRVKVDNDPDAFWAVSRRENRTWQLTLYDPEDKVADTLAGLESATVVRSQLVRMVHDQLIVDARYERALQRSKHRGDQVPLPHASERPTPQSTPEHSALVVLRAQIQVYGEVHGFYDIPDLTDWSQPQLERFFDQVQRMVANDEYTEWES